MESVAQGFVDLSRRYLSTEFLPKIRACVAQLSEEDLWWRPNEASNSIGNLLLHLAGNVRQWIVSGIGGAPDERRRQEEFDRRAPVQADELLRNLGRAVEEADAVLAGLPLERLPEAVRIQGREVTVQEAVYHVVEHFSMHTGQILYITKLRRARDLGFYEVEDGVTHARWEGRARD